MLEVNRKREVIKMLENGFNKKDNEWVISVRDVSFIFRGGRYAEKEIEECIIEHSKKCKEDEKFKLIEHSENGHGKLLNLFYYFINLKFLSAIIRDVTDDPNDIESFYCYYNQNMEIFDTTTPQDCAVSSIVSIGYDLFRATK